MKNKLGSILLIDDNPDDNFYHQIILEDAKVADRIIAKDTAIKALDYLRAAYKNPDEYIIPDIIFLDINMPGMNGFEFLEIYNEEFADKKKSTIIMMLTTSTLNEDKRKAFELGVREFLNKPLNKESINELLSKLYK